MIGADTVERQGMEASSLALKLGFRELVLIHSSLEAVRTLGLAEHQDDLLTDTLQLLDVALEESV
jgi:hypothetical protein